MTMDLSPVEMEELKELIEASINKITSEMQHVRTPQKKIELKDRRDELNNILIKIDSKMGQLVA